MHVGGKVHGIGAPGPDRDVRFTFRDSVGRAFSSSIADPELPLDWRGRLELIVRDLIDGGM